MKHFRTAVAAFAAMMSALVWAGPQEVFEGYKAALISQDAQKAVSLLSESTINSYGRDIEAARYSSKEELQELSLQRRFTVLVYRLLVPVELMKDMDGKGILMYAMENNLMGSLGSIADMSARGFSAGGKLATASVYIDGQELPFLLSFWLEDDQWTFDLMPFLNYGETAFDNMAGNSGMSEDEFLIQLLEGSLGIAVDESIWQPLLKKSAE